MDKEDRDFMVDEFCERALIISQRIDNLRGDVLELFKKNERLGQDIFEHMLEDNEVYDRNLDPIFSKVNDNTELLKEVYEKLKECGDLIDE